MAERRMFAKTIIESDAFLDMPVTARLLYYDLAMRADDDGFVNSPKKIMRMISASEDDIKILILRKFIIPFDNGIVVIKHWRIHNYIRTDRYNETTYKSEKELLEIGENKAYQLKSEKDENTMVYQRSTNGIPTVDTGKVRLGKVSIGKDSIYKDTGKPEKHKYGEYNHVKLTDDEYKRLCDEYTEATANLYIKKVDEYCEMKNKSYHNYNLAIRNFMRRDNVSPNKISDEDLYAGLTRDSEGFYVDKDGNRYV